MSHPVHIVKKNSEPRVQVTGRRWTIPQGTASYARVLAAPAPITEALEQASQHMNVAGRSQQSIINATKANEPSYNNAWPALRAETSEVGTNTKDVSEVLKCGGLVAECNAPRDEYAGKLDNILLMFEIAEKITDTILFDLVAARHKDIYMPNLLTYKLISERRQVQVPPGFQENPLSSQSLAFIQANITFLPVHHTFVSALQAHNVTIDVWKLARNIIGERNINIEPECSTEEFEAVGRGYADSQKLNPAAREVMGRLCRTARDIVEAEAMMN